MIIIAIITGGVTGVKHIYTGWHNQLVCLSLIYMWIQWRQNVELGVMKLQNVRNEWPILTTLSLRLAVCSYYGWIKHNTDTDTMLRTDELPSVTVNPWPTQRK